MPLTRPRFNQFDTTISSISDPITILNKSSTLANIDVGFIFNRDGGTSSNVAVFWDESANTFVTSFTTDSGSDNANITITEYANLRVGTLTATLVNTTGNIVAAVATVGAVEAAGMIYANSTTNSTSTTTGALRVAGGIGIVGNIWADRIHAGNNGNGTNFRVGDDLWLGDINVANTMRLMGQQDNTQAFIRFGNTNNSSLGVSGSGPLSWGGVLNVTGNILGATASFGAINSTGFINTAGNVSAAVHTGGQVSVTGLINTTGNIMSAGNITAPYYFGNGSQLSGVITSVTKIINGTSDITAYSGSNIAVTVGGTANTVVFTSSNVHFAGSLIPTANLTFDLGAPTKRWRDAYFSGNTIYLGNAVISSSGTDIFISTTGGFGFPVGTTEQRTDTQGGMRFNTTLNKFEAYDGVSWNSLAYGTLTDFPTGDYGDLTGVTTDAFGVATASSFDCNEEGAITTTDFEVLT